MTSFEDELVELISQESGVEPAALRATKGLMSSGVLDSFALVTIISFVESHIGSEVPPADLSFDNFDSIDGICSYVDRALAA